MTIADPSQTVMRMLLRSIDAAEWQVVESLFHPQVEYEISGFLPLRGRDNVMNYYQHVRPVRRGEHIIESMVVDGDRGIVWGRFNATMNDGREQSVLFADIMNFVDRKIRKRRVYLCDPKA